LRTLTPDLHARFLRAARRVSRPLERAIKAIGPIGFRQPRQRDLGQHLARVIVGQQLSTRAARTIWARVAAVAGPQTLVFCTADKLDALRACGLSRNKALALIALREAGQAGQLDARRLSAMDAAKRTQHLTALRGIGPWSVDMVSIFYFRDLDVWPLGDLVVRKTFERFVAGHATYDQRSGAALFAPHRSFLALYMWRIANEGPDE
jgi:DNA-3-methyladenine glycosylase II